MKIRTVLWRLTLALVGLLALLAVVGWWMLPGDFEVSEAWTVLRRRNLELATQLKDAIVQSDGDVAKIGETRGLPLISLKLSRKDIVHFVNLYKKYEDPKFGIPYYAQHNLWRNAELTYEGRTYEVKVKSHGRSPTNHRSGKYISLAIRMPRGEHIRHSRRFSLLVRDHFVPKKQVVFDVADHMGLLKNQEDLVRVKINNWDEKLFYFDRRLNDAFMEVEGRPSLRIFGYAFSDDSTNKSSLYTGGPFDEAAYRARFKQTLLELEYPESQHQPLIDRFTEFSKALYEQRYEELAEFCDIDYVSSFQAMRLITGLIGHTARVDNLYVFYDTANGKFYPVVTRDCWMEKMQVFENGSAELFVDTAGPWEQPLYKMLSRNLDVRRGAYQKIHEYIQQVGPSIGERHRLIQERYEKLSYFGWATVGMRRAGLMQDDYTVHNLRTLQHYMETPQPKLKVTMDQDKLLLSIAPWSMAGVKIDYFRIAANKNASPVDLPVSVWGEYETGGQTQYIPLRQATVRAAGGRIDLTPLLQDFEFVTPLTAESQRQARQYAVLVKFESTEVLPGEGPIELLLSNRITGTQITDFAATVQRASFSESAFRATMPPPADTRWLAGHEELALVVNADTVTVRSGDYTLERDLILPKDRKLIIEAGTTLRLGKDVAICGYQGIEVRGTKESPVTITPIDPTEPFGSVGILGNQNTTSRLEYLQVRGGFERWVRGVYFSGAMSIHENGTVEVRSCSFENNLADDGLNIKYCPRVTITDCDFRDNAADQVDLDLCDGVVEDCRFQIETRRDANGDGLDVSGSRLSVSGCRFQGFPDKGMSVGEQSRLEVRNNRYDSNTVGIAVKDSSHAFLVDNQFSGNRVDMDGFQKKGIFDGGTIWLSRAPSKTVKIYLDAKSRVWAADSLVAFAEALHAGEEVLEASTDRWKPVPATVTEEPLWRIPRTTGIPEAGEVGNASESDADKADAAEVEVP